MSQRTVAAEIASPSRGRGANAPGGALARRGGWLMAPALRPLWLLLMIVVLWDLSIRIFGIKPYLVPKPWSVAQQLVGEWPMLWRETLPTLYATLGGFAAAAVVGVLLATWIAYSRLIESFVYPLLVFSQSIPKVAVAPLFVVWFGFGMLPKVIVAFLLGFFPVVVATVQGFKSVEPDVIDLARSMGASPLKVFLKFRLPTALPSIFSGLKVSITLAVVGAVVGEFVGSNSGIGYVMQKATGTFDLPLMFAALVILSLVGMVLFWLIELAERALLPWHASQRVDLQPGI